MTTTPHPIPAGYHSVTPYIAVKNAAKAIDFYKKAFDAVEKSRMQHGNKVGHADIQIGNSHIMLSDMFTDPSKLPETSPVNFYVYVEDVDSFYKKALAAGAKQFRPVETQFYGDRTGALHDPFGLTWHIATHVEDVAPDEMKKRADKAFAACAEQTSKRPAKKS
jgi:PhnB protein